MQACALSYVPLLVARYKDALCFVTAFIFPFLPIEVSLLLKYLNKGCSSWAAPTPNTQSVNPVVRSDAGIGNFNAKSFSLVPPPSSKLIDKSGAENFMEMSEMLSDDMGILENEDYLKPTKAKLHNILERVCCFTLYISIQSIQKTATISARFTIISIAHLNGKQFQTRNNAATHILAVFPDCDIEHPNFNCFSNSSIVDKYT